MLIFTTLIFQDQRQTSQVYIIKEAPYMELSLLEGHQPQNATHFIPPSYTNVCIIYTVITTIETHPHLIGVMISKSRQEVLQLDQY